MATDLGPIGNAGTILFVENAGNITAAISNDFATFGAETGVGNATQAQKQVYIYNRVVANPGGFGTTQPGGFAQLPAINNLFDPAIAQAMLAVAVGGNMTDAAGNNIAIEALSAQALIEIAGLPAANAAVLTAIVAHANANAASDTAVAGNAQLDAAGYAAKLNADHGTPAILNALAANAGAGAAAAAGGLLINQVAARALAADPNITAATLNALLGNANNFADVAAAVNADVNLRTAVAGNAQLDAAGYAAMLNADHGTPAILNALAANAGAGAAAAAGGLLINQVAARALAADPNTTAATLNALLGNANNFADVAAAVNADIVGNQPTVQNMLRNANLNSNIIQLLMANRATLAAAITAEAGLGNAAIGNILGFASVRADNDNAAAAIVALGTHANITNAEDATLTAAIQACPVNLTIAQLQQIQTHLNAHGLCAGARAAITARLNAGGGAFVVDDSVDNVARAVVQNNPAMRAVLTASANQGVDALVNTVAQSFTPAFSGGVGRVASQEEARTIKALPEQRRAVVLNKVLSFL